MSQSGFSAIVFMFYVLIQKTWQSDFPHIYGFVAHLSELTMSNDIAEFRPHTKVGLTLFGKNLNKADYVSFTTINSTIYSKCDHLRNTNSFQLTHYGNTSSCTIYLRPLVANETVFFFCLGEILSTNHSDTTTIIWRHQGHSSNVLLKVRDILIPFWLQIIIVIVLFVLSGLFSGLNLGLMSLSLTDLQLFEAAGSPNERRYAHIIRPVRDHGNFLLSTLLIGNVLVNSTLTIFVDGLTGNGLVAILGSSLGIVIFGEIIPQAVTSRYALVIGAKTMWITKLFMGITFILSFPIGKILDALLGKELGVVYNREKLEILVREQQKMGSVVKEEVNIIAGALNITTKTVKEIMTPLDDAFMIPYSSILNFDLLNQIVKNGFTRIPVYEKERNNIIAVLNIKDLTLIDCDENIPVTTVCSFYKRPILVVEEGTFLREILDEFKKGRTHLAFVAEYSKTSDDRTIIGLVTLEDVIEEIIQAEIIDETDIITDNVQKNKRSVLRQDFGYLHDSGAKSDLSPQLKLSALQHLYAEVSSFREELISFNVLKSLLNANIVENLSYSIQNSSSNILITKGKAMKYAIFLLQGRVSVKVSMENLYFETGPLMFFGEGLLKNINNILSSNKLHDDQLCSIVKKAKKSCQYIPDYSLTALTNVVYITVSIEHYIFARYLSQRKCDNRQSFPDNILRSDTGGTSFQEEWDLYWSQNDEKLLPLNKAKQKNNHNCAYRDDSFQIDLWQPFSDHHTDLDPLLAS